MHILFTNNTLEHEAGSERSVCDVSEELMARGHRISAFSCQLGGVARKLAESGIGVYSDLNQMTEQPDIIHGHHEWETSLAALRWPTSAVVSFRRGIDPWQETPCLAPWTAAWVGVDRPCLQHLVEVDGVPVDRAHLLLNGIRMDGLKPRTSLPAHPAKVLVLSNYATEDNFLGVIREACRAEGINCEAIGRGVRNVKNNLLELLPSYDLVFAKGRAALEAIAAGCAVVVCDYGGMGEFVTTSNFTDLRERSFYYDCELEPVTPELVRQRLSEWQPEDSTKLSEEMRQTCSLTASIDALETIYATALDRDQTPTVAETSSFASQFLADKGLPYKLGREIQSHYRDEKQLPPPSDAEAAATEWNRALNLHRKGRAAATKVEEPKRPRRRRWLGRAEH